MWPIKTIAYFIFFWVACLASLFNPIWGVVNYMMAYQMNPPVMWWGKPLAATGMRFSMLATIFTLLGIFFARRRLPKIVPSFSFWELCLFSLLLLAVVNTLLGVAFGSPAQASFEKFWKLQVFVLILARLATTRENLQIVIWTIVAGCLYLGYDAYTAPFHAFTKGRLEVFGGPDISTSSGASAHLTAMLPIIGIAFLIARTWSLKLFAAVAGALTFNAIILCRTRSAFVGLLCGGIVAILMAPKAMRHKIRLLLVVGALLAFSLTDVNYWERMSTLADSETLAADPAAAARTDIRTASVELLSDYPLGVGLGNFPVVIGKYSRAHAHRAPHNTLVMCFTELGILGGVIFLALILESLRIIHQCTRNAKFSAKPLETHIMCYGFMVAIVTYTVSGLGTDRFTCESYWWILTFPLCLKRMILGELRDAKLAPQTAPTPALADPAFVGQLRYGY